MCSQTTLNMLLEEASVELNKLFGNKLESVVLYGSYARGDYDHESDIDVMALIDIEKEDLYKYRRIVSKIASNIDLKYDVLLSIKLQDKPTFEKYQNVLPFFRNVIREGVRVSV